MNIHPTAIIESGAIIGEGTSVGAYSCIGSKVKIGKGNRIGSHVVIEGNTTIGDENNIFQFASIGSIPQDLKYKGEDSQLHIGNQNIIREYVTLQPGTEGGGLLTKIGDKNLFMACSHVGHDCHIGNNNIFANSVGISGHVLIEDGVIIGGLAAVHQFVRLGRLAYIGGGSMVTKDVPPFCLANGDRAVLIGLNLVGLKRNGFSVEVIKKIKRTFKDIFLKKGLMQDKLDLLNKNVQTEEEKEFINFILNSKRGVCVVERSLKQKDLEEAK